MHCCPKHIPCVYEVITTSYCPRQALTWRPTAKGTSFHTTGGQSSSCSRL